MISNEISLSHEEKITSFTQANLLSIRQFLYERIKSRFLQKSAKYLGSTYRTR